MSDRVAVVGGGVAGLATAFHLHRAGADPVVLERDRIPGGIVTLPVEVGDLWLEPGPDSVLHVDGPSLGGYAKIAEIIFPHLAVDSYLLEYDDERSGGFEPLSDVPDGKLVVLGLVTTKTGRPETVEELEGRVREAARFIPLERLALSPQCGFATSVLGNAISPAQEEAKLRTIVEAARRVWE